MATFKPCKTKIGEVVETPMGKAMLKSMSFELEFEKGRKIIFKIGGKR